MSSVIIWIYLCIVLCLFNVADGQDGQCPGLSFTINPNADVKFSVISTIRLPDGEKCSGRISPSAVQRLAAMQWVVDRMNANNFTEGVKIGKD